MALCCRISRRLLSHGPLEMAGFNDLVSNVRFPILFTYSLRNSVAMSSGKFPENEVRGQCCSHCRGIKCSMVRWRSVRTFSVLLVKHESLSASRIMRTFERLTFL